MGGIKSWKIDRAQEILVSFPSGVQVGAATANAFWTHQEPRKTRLLAAKSRLVPVFDSILVLRQS